jgi:hypothetical protein
MPFQRRNVIYLIILLAAAMVASLFLLFKPITKEETTYSTISRQANPVNYIAIDSSLQYLQSGDIVVRTGSDVTSYMLSQFNQLDKTYSHCGVVIIENGYPFVYHSIGGEDNPDAKIRRDSIKQFFSPANNLGFGIARLRISEQQSLKLQQIVKQYYSEKRMFDMSFDLNTDDRLYCAEFVYKAVNQAVADNKFLKPVTMFGYTYVAIDNIVRNEHISLICQVRFK